MSLPIEDGHSEVGDKMANSRLEPFAKLQSQVQWPPLSSSGRKNPKEMCKRKRKLQASYSKT